MQDPSGQALPDMHIHGAMLLAKQGGKWQVVEGRPYALAPRQPPRRHWRSRTDPRGIGRGPVAPGTERNGQRLHPRLGEWAGDRLSPRLGEWDGDRLRERDEYRLSPSLESGTATGSESGTSTGSTSGSESGTGTGPTTDPRSDASSAPPRPARAGGAARSDSGPGARSVGDESRRSTRWRRRSAMHAAAAPD